VRCTNILNNGNWAGPGEREPDRNLTICSSESRWYDFEENSISALEAADEKEYVLQKSELGSDGGKVTVRVTIDRKNGTYIKYAGLFRGQALVKFALFKGQCKKVPLKPIPKDAGKPKF
jgi:hypothetical protein